MISAERGDRPARPGDEARARTALRVVLACAAVGLATSVVPIFLGASGAFRIQIVAAMAGAIMSTTGAGLIALVWRRWRLSEVRRLVGSFGFLLCCFGAVAMLAGIGIYH